MKFLKLLLSILLTITLFGCSTDTNSKVEKALLNNGYQITIVDDEIIIETRYPNELGGSPRWWYYDTDSESKVCFKDTYLLPGISIDPNSGQVVDIRKETIDLISESTIKKFHDVAKAELNNFGITIDELAKYMEYKINEDPVDIANENNTTSFIPEKIATSREVLYLTYSSSIEEIDKLSDADVDLYSKYEEKGFDTFSSLQEYVVLNDDNYPEMATKYAKKFKEATDGKYIHLDGFRFYEDEGSFGICYDVMIDVFDSGLNLLFMHDNEEDQFVGISFCGTPKSGMDAETALDACALFVRTIDDSLSDTKSFEIVAKSFSEPVLENGWIYYVAEGDEFMFNIIPYNK